MRQILSWTRTARDLELREGLADLPNQVSFSEAAGQLEAKVKTKKYQAAHPVQAFAERLAVQRTPKGKQ